MVQFKKLAETEEKFGSISESVEKSKGILSELNTSSHEVFAKNEDIVKIIRILADIADKNAETTTEAAEHVGTLVGEILDILKASENLNEIANRLREEVNQFYI